MNCKSFQKEIVDFVGNEPLPSEIQKHLSECKDCAEEFEKQRRIISSLKPRIEVKANKELKNSIINKLEENENIKPNNKKIFFIQKIIKVAASVLIIITLSYFLNFIFLSNPAKAAEKVFENSLKALKNIKSLFVKLNVRTIENDNFELIGTKYDFAEHTIIKEFGNNGKWKIEKPLRVVAFDGKSQYLFVKNIELAIKDDSAKIEFVSWLKKILNPEELLSMEINNAKNSKDSKYKINKTDSLIILTIESKAKGSFENPYLKNTSIEQSDCKIIYTFSVKDSLLRDLELYVKESNKETLVLDIESIEYNKMLSHSDFEIQLPNGIIWKSNDEKINNSKFSNISAKMAAQLFFEALSKSNWKEIEDVFVFLNKSSDNSIKEFKDDFGGLDILSIGEPFKSGLFPGMFVPYEIKLKNGEIQKNNLALRNDNPFKVWIVDGGL